MKNNKILTTGVVAALILSLGTSSIYAYGGNDGGRGQGMGKYLTEEQREEVENMDQDERQEYMQKLREEKGISNDNMRGQGKGNNKGGNGGEHNPGEMIADIPSSDLTDKEIEILSYGYSEELLARDVYAYLYDLYGEDIFNNISESEQKHMDAVKVLIDRYNLDTPTGYGELQSTFDALIAEGEKGLKEALEVGIQIEILDIEDIEGAIANTDNEDFKVVFTNIGGASYNHLRAFVKALDNNNFESNIDYSEFMSVDDLNTKGPLKYKLAERLESAGIDLPSQVSSEELKNKKGHGNNEENSRSMGENKGKGRSDMQNSNRSGNAKMYTGSNNISINQSLKNRYKTTIETKYSSKIDVLSIDKMNTIIVKIDDLSEKISTSTVYDDSKKEKYLAMLDALKDLLLEKLGEEELNLDNIFE